MKTIIVFVLAFIALFGLAFGKIRNGYESQLDDCKKSLKAAKALLSPWNNLSKTKQRTLKAKITNLANYISYYELTRELLEQLMAISPDLYYEIDNLKDKRGRETDIFVKLVPREDTAVPLIGAAIFAQAPDDEDAHNSEYGKYTVSVKICLVNNALKLLYHELGHVSYVVPNLAAYTKFYRTHYCAPGIALTEVGHKPYDMSGRAARSFEMRFRKDYARYQEEDGVRFDSMLTLMQKQKRNHRHQSQEQMLFARERSEGLAQLHTQIR